VSPLSGSTEPIDVLVSPTPARTQEPRPNRLPRLLRMNLRSRPAPHVHCRCHECGRARRSSHVIEIGAQRSRLRRGYLRRDVGSDGAAAGDRFHRSTVPELASAKATHRSRGAPSPARSLRQEAVVASWPLTLAGGDFRRTARFRPFRQSRSRRLSGRRGWLWVGPEERRTSADASALTRPLGLAWAKVRHRDEPAVVSKWPVIDKRWGRWSASFGCGLWMQWPCRPKGEICLGVRHDRGGVATTAWAGPIAPRLRAHGGSRGTVRGAAIGVRSRVVRGM
jgi:hypothetical protein